MTKTQRNKLIREISDSASAWRPFKCVPDNCQAFESQATEMHEQILTLLDLLNEPATKETKTVVGGTEYTSNPERYARCAMPFANAEEANAATKAFLEAVSAAREEYLIANVSVVIKDSMTEGVFMNRSHYGDVMEAETMLAYGLGQANRDRRRVIQRLMAGLPPLGESK